MGGVGGGLGTSQHAAGVEDIEALVLHGAHVEVVDRDDHEDVQVVFAPVHLLVPLHRLFQAVHGVLHLVDVFRLDIDAQRHLATTHGGEAILDAPQVAGNQREQVSRLLERVFPGRPVTAALLAAAGNRVAVGEQHRIAMLFGAERGGEFTHHVGAIEVVGNLAEALGLALRTEHAAGLVQAFQRGIAFRVDTHAAVDDELLVRRLQAQLAVAQLVITRHQYLVIQFQLQQLQLLAIQYQQRKASARLGVTPHH